MTRIQVVISEIEREAFRRAAAREGLSLSEFLRRAARDRIAFASAARPGSVEELRAFFQECDEREEGEEPDWRKHASPPCFRLMRRTCGPDVSWLIVIPALVLATSFIWPSVAATESLR